MIPPTLAAVEAAGKPHTPSTSLGFVAVCESEMGPKFGSTELNCKKPQKPLSICPDSMRFSYCGGCGRKLAWWAKSISLLTALNK